MPTLTAKPRIVNCPVCKVPGSGCTVGDVIVGCVVTRGPRPGWVEIGNAEDRPGTYCYMRAEPARRTIQELFDYAHPTWREEYAAIHRPKIATAHPSGQPRARSHDLIDRERRAVAYLSKMPPAVAGQGGHRALMAAARAVCWGFDLGDEAGYEILAQHFNPRCAPPWSESELRHKCRDAMNERGAPYPRGHLLDKDRDDFRPRTRTTSRTISNAPPIPAVRTGPLTPLMQGFDANGVLTHEAGSPSCCVEEHVDATSRVTAASIIGPTPEFNCERPRILWCRGKQGTSTDGKEAILSYGCRNGCDSCRCYKRYLDKSRYVPHALAAGTHYHIGTDADREKLRDEFRKLRKRLKLKDRINYATCGQLTIYCLGHINPAELPTDCGLEPAAGGQCAQLLADHIDNANPLERMKGERLVHASQQWPNGLEMKRADEEEKPKEKLWEVVKNVRVVNSDMDWIEGQIREAAGEPIDIQRGTTNVNGESKLSVWVSDRIIFTPPIGKRGEIIDRITCRAEPSANSRSHTSNDYRPEPSPILW